MERAGSSRAPSIFANALSARVLRAHADGPLETPQLEEMLAWAPASSVRAAEKRLCDLGALVEVSPAKGTHGAVFELTAAGWDLLRLATVLECWLEDGPRGPLPLDDPAAQGIVKALASGWDSGVVRTLAERPHTLADLSGEIAKVTYPGLKRRVAKLRSIGLITPVSAGSGSAYVVSEWLRRAVAPMVLAGRWERRHGRNPAPIGRADVEAVFLLALPLVELSNKVSGSCALAVLLSASDDRPQREVAGVSIEVSKGRVVASTAGAAIEPETWALGDPDAWFSSLVEGNPQALRIKGADPRLAERVIEALNKTLFAGEWM